MEIAIAPQIIQGPSAGPVTEPRADDPSRPNQNWKGIWKPVAALIFGAGLIVGGLGAAGLIAILSYGALSPVSFWLGSLAIGAGVVVISLAIRDLFERGSNRNSDASLTKPAPFLPSSNDEALMQYDGQFGGKRIAAQRESLIQVCAAKPVIFSSHFDERINRLVEYYDNLSIKPELDKFFGEMEASEITDLSDLLFQPGVREKLIREPDALDGLSSNAIVQLRRTSPCQLFVDGRLTSAQLKRMDDYYRLNWQAVYPALSTENCKNVLKDLTTIDKLIAQDPNLNRPWQLLQGDW